MSNPLRRYSKKPKVPGQTSEVGSKQFRFVSYAASRKQLNQTTSVRSRSGAELFRKKVLLTKSKESMSYLSAPKPLRDTLGFASIALKVLKLRVVQILLTLFLLGLFGWQSTLNVKAPRVDVIGENTIKDSREYGTYLETLLQSDWRSHSKILVQKQQIQQQLREHFPEIESVDLHIPMLGRLPTATVHLYRVALVLNEQTDNYLVSPSGVIIGNVMAVGVPTSVPLVKNSGVALAKVENKILSTQEVSFITAVTQGVKSAGLKTNSLILPFDEPFSVNLQLQSKSYYIKLSMLEDPFMQLGRMSAAMTYFSKEKITPNEYVDVRVEGKAYFK